jgi:uncharacterized protein YutE (UPF0331/DUF86 family)
MKTLNIVIHRTAEVDLDVAAAIASDFLEWLDGVGFELIRKSGTADNRSYTDLAQEWVEEVTGTRES